MIEGAFPLAAATSNSEEATSWSEVVESEERAVRELVEAWAWAVRAHDLPGVVARHAHDLVYFDVPQPVEQRGLEAYARSWPPFFGYIGSRGQFELGELRVAACLDVAFAHALLLVRGHSETATARVRLTLGLCKREGRWLVVHEHHSAPLP